MVTYAWGKLQNRIAKLAMVTYAWGKLQNRIAKLAMVTYAWGKLQNRIAKLATVTYAWGIQSINYECTWWRLFNLLTMSVADDGYSIY
jgi:hypothetical protein